MIWKIDKKIEKRIFWKIIHKKEAHSIVFIFNYTIIKLFTIAIFIIRAINQIVKLCP